MHFRSILSGTLAVLLAASMAAPAFSAGNGQQGDGGFSLHLPKIGLPGVFGSKATDDTTAAPVRVAQSADGSSAGLQDQIRSLNGKIEELNFQVLQMQEQIRKTQEDNEFRFQQLEQGGGSGGGSQKKSDASGSGNDRSVAQAPAGASQANGASQSPAASAAPSGGAASSADEQSIGDIIVDSGNGEPGKLIHGAPPKSLGAITVDKNGNVISADPSSQAAAPATSGKSGQDSQVAALPATGNAEELYRNSYQFILSGDYSTAEKGFRDHIARFPKDPKAADAHYWLGESLLGQQKYRDAAEVFLAASKDYSKAKKAPDMLLKLGISLVALHQRDVACATFSEIGKRYPDASSALKERVKQERSLAAC
ncbi:tol-pal system protein YbgF [Mesorhizobium sp. SP-1A]|uniref:tol-pal system protein YbgF n=1 Tax=Mesorhizobium sp. SP-1A TaxID=3077840 RepID=UPI0028F6C9B5|nr:tol-pal system protein YbgF [Mesorhizobium sp. SP-1A]